ncbi:MAG: hypothetical protein K2X27_06695 [Candidatus Obscuribacterales bacterium]|nr:hypothetical protein [Candidatus Obscuribacterales bacterium]
MKIEIDLQEILRDEYGDKESLAESIHRQITETLTANLKKGIEERINSEIATLINEQIKAVVANQMPSLAEDLMNAEYLEVDKWGDQGREKTTVRKELVKEIHKQMTYKPDQYSSNRNTFTKAVDAAVEEHVKGFKKAYDQAMVELFQKEAFEYAVNKMSEKLGLTVAKR